MSTIKSDNATTFGKRLKNTRKRVRLTQQELADKAQIAKDTLSRYERDVLVPTIEAFNKLYYALREQDRGITTDSLLFDSYEEGHKRYRVKNLGQVASLLFHGGGRAVIEYDNADICTILRALVHHEGEKKVPNQGLIDTLNSLQSRYMNQKFIIEGEAFIAIHEATLKSVMGSSSSDEKERETPFQQITTLKK